VKTDGAQGHPEVYRAGEEGESVTGRRRHLKVFALVTVPVAPRTKLTAVGREEGEPIDVVGRRASRDPDDAVVAQVQRLSLHLVLQDAVDPAVPHLVLIWIEHIEGPDKALVDHLHLFWEAGCLVVDEEGSLFRVAKRSRHITGVGRSPLSRRANAVRR